MYYLYKINYMYKLTYILHIYASYVSNNLTNPRGHGGPDLRHSPFVEETSHTYMKTSVCMFEK